MTLHTTQDGWDVAVMTRSFGPWIKMTWSAEARGALIAIDERAPIFFGEQLVISPVPSPKHACRIGLALAAALDTVAEIIRP